MNKRTCTRCKVEQSLDCFYKDKCRKDDFSSHCKTCYANKHKEFRKNNPVKIKQKKTDLEIKKRKKDWYERNKDKAIVDNKNWREQNPAKVLNANHLRRTRKLKNGLFLVTVKELNKLYSSACVYCGSEDGIQMDHVVPLSRGGRHSIGNLVPACSKCNLSKGNKYLAEWLLAIRL